MQYLRAKGAPIGGGPPFHVATLVPSQSGDPTASQRGRVLRKPGVDLLHRLVVAAHLVFDEVGPSGTRLVSEFIRLLDLESFVGTSHGCQYDVRVRIEEGLVDFGKEKRARLASTMQSREITVCQDETFRPTNPGTLQLNVPLTQCTAHNAIQTGHVIGPQKECYCEIVETGAAVVDAVVDTFIRSWSEL